MIEINYISFAKVSCKYWKKYVKVLSGILENGNNAIYQKPENIVLFFNSIFFFLFFTNLLDIPFVYERLELITYEPTC